jgi:ketosteroid isomerase-like protein
MRFSENEARRFVARWLAVQNGHDFDGYARMYAANFAGVKRTPSGRATRFARAAWLADRRPMMTPSKHLHLRAENLRVYVNDDHAVVFFDQHFNTMNYGDWGPKILRLRGTPLGLRIEHEEMLTSFGMPGGACC